MNACVNGLFKWFLSQGGALVLIGAVTVLFQHSATTAGAAVPVQLSVSNTQELSQQIEELYKGLVLEGRFPVVNHVVEKGDTVEKLMRKQSGYSGAYFPVVLDAIACDLNPKTCRRKLRIKPGASKRRSGTIILKTTTQLIPTYGDWSRLQPGQLLILPSIKISKTQSTKTYQKKSGESIESVLATNETCLRQSIDYCLDTVDFLNGKSGLHRERGFSGEILVPSTEYHASIPQLCQPLCAEVRVFQFDLNIQSFASKPYDVRYNVVQPTWVPGAQQLKSNKELFSSGIRGVLKAGRPVQLPSDLQHKSSHDHSVAFHIEQLDQLKVHSYPFDKVRDAAGALPVSVMVIDRRFDVNHCEFDDGTLQVYDCSSKESVENNELFCPNRSGLDLSAGGQRKACDDPGLLEFEEIERSNRSAVELRHGTHMAGIIAAKHKHGSIGRYGTAGVNPHASIIGVEINTHLLQTDGLYAVALRGKLYQLILKKRIDIVNFSYGYKGELAPTVTDEGQLESDDQILRLIKDFKNSTLFVVPAGNNEDNNSDVCRLLPACAVESVDNILAVVALNEMQKPLFPNAGNEKFAVGAIGKNVLAPSLLNKFTRFNGSSQSVALVSGIASLANSFKVKWTPRKYINRLISCSKFTSVNNFKQSQGGSVDIDCFLDFELDRVVLENGIVNGKLIKIIDGKEASVLNFTDQDNGFDIRLQLNQIGGFQQINGDGNDIVVFQRRMPGAKLNRFRGAFNENLNQIKLRIEHDGGHRDIPLRQVRHYVSRGS